MLPNGPLRKNARLDDVIGAVNELLAKAVLMGGVLRGSRLSVRILPAAISAAHELLEHSDTTPGTVVKGDLVVGSGTTPTWVRLPVGTNGYVVVADSAVTAGVKWAPTSSVDSPLAMHFFLMGG